MRKEVTILPDQIDSILVGGRGEINVTKEGEEGESSNFICQSDHDPYFDSPSGSKSVSDRTIYAIVPYSPG